LLEGRGEKGGALDLRVDHSRYTKIYKGGGGRGITSKIQSLMFSKQRPATKERGSTTPLKVSAFLLFQMLQAIVVLILASSYVQQHGSQKSQKLAKLRASKSQ
jgi:hypothetical protein